MSGSPPSTPNNYNGFGGESTNNYTAPPSSYSYSSSDSSSSQYSILSNKVMIAAIITLFCVIFFVLLLHIYVRWIWRNGPSSVMMNHRRRIHRMNFSGIDLNSPLNDQSRGLDKATIDQLPTFTYNKSGDAHGYGADNQDGVLECAVCLSEFEEDEKGRLLPSCKHSFHTECIDMWFSSHSTCPLCRTVVMAPAAKEVTVDLGFQHEGTESGQGQSEARAPLQALVESSNVSTGISTGDAGRYPNNVLFWGNHSYVNSHRNTSGLPPSPRPPSSPRLPLSSPRPPLTPRSSTTSTVTSPLAMSPRSLPRANRPSHISIEVRDSSSSFSFSTAVSRCTSPNQCDHVAVVSPQPLRSPGNGLRTTIKRMLSRQSSREKDSCSSGDHAGDSSSTKAVV